MLRSRKVDRIGFLKCCSQHFSEIILICNVFSDYVPSEQWGYAAQRYSWEHQLFWEWIHLQEITGGHCWTVFYSYRWRQWKPCKNWFKYNSNIWPSVLSCCLNSKWHFFKCRIHRVWLTRSTGCSSGQLDTLQWFTSLMRTSLSSGTVRPQSMSRLDLAGRLVLPSSTVNS